MALPDRGTLDADDADDAAPLEKASSCLMKGCIGIYMLFRDG